MTSEERRALRLEFARKRLASQSGGGYVTIMASNREEPLGKNRASYPQQCFQPPLHDSDWVRASDPIYQMRLDYISTPRGQSP